MSAIQRIRAKIDAAKAQRQLDAEERAAARKDAEYEAAKEKALRKSERIKQEEIIRAREGGFFTRLGRAGIARGIEEARKYGKSKPAPRRRTTKKVKKVQPKRKMKKSSARPKRRVVSYYY